MYLLFIVLILFPVLPFAEEIPSVSAEKTFYSCWYQAKPTHKAQQSEFSEHKNCAFLTETKQLSINPTQLKTIDFNRDNLAVIYFRGQFYYFSKQGRAMPAISYDNWADDFNDGLARTNLGGKIGYFNKNLKLVIPAQYDWGFPFKNGRAAVCMECRKEPMGEHQKLSGGLWGVINLKGKLIKPLAPR